MRKSFTIIAIAIIAVSFYMVVGMFLEPLTNFFPPVGSFFRLLIFVYVIRHFIKFLCDLTDFISIEECYLTFRNISIRGIFVAIALIIIFFLLRTGGAEGQWKFNTSYIAVINALNTILYSGFCSGITEEMLFRGYLTAISRKYWGKFAGICLPTTFFVLAHSPLAGKSVPLSFFHVVMYSVICVLFTVLADMSHSIMDSAFIHAIWNVFISGDDIISVNTTVDRTAIFTFVITDEGTRFINNPYIISSFVVSVIIIFLLLWELCYRQLKKGSRSR